METIDWKKVESLGYRRASRLRKIEHALASYPEGLNSEQLCHEVGLTSEARIRTLQNDLNKLRELYTGKQEITRSPHRLLLKGDDLAFPEAEFSTKDRKQLNAICRLIAFFDGAVPIKDVLNVSVSEAEKALKGMSDSIDVSTNGREIRYIKEIYDAIENRYVLDLIFPRLNEGKEFPFAPYMLKRFNSKWFVIGRMYVDNPFDWTVIPLAAIPILNKHKGGCKYFPKKMYELSELKQRIRAYYNNVLGFHVPMAEQDLDKLPRSLDPDKLPVEDIRLKCNPLAIRFIKENPIHDSQRVDESNLEVSMNIVINPLLVQQILKYGDEIEVLHPTSLRMKIKSIIERIHTKYHAN